MENVLFSVKDGYPGEAGYVDDKDAEILAMWNELQVFYENEIMHLLKSSCNIFFCF